MVVDEKYENMVLEQDALLEITDQSKVDLGHQAR